MELVIRVTSDFNPISVKYNLTYFPNIFFYVSSVQEVVSYQPLVPAIVRSDGSVSWHFPTLLKSTCRLKVDYFPWDQQICELKYGSWTYDVTEVGWRIRPNFANNSIMLIRNTFSIDLDMGLWVQRRSKYSGYTVRVSFCLHMHAPLVNLF